MRPFVCARCRKDKSWLLSCIHTFTDGLRTPSPKYTVLCEHPHAAEHTQRGWAAVPGPAEPDRYTRAVTMPLATRRWYAVAPEHQRGAYIRPIWDGDAERAF